MENTKKNENKPKSAHTQRTGSISKITYLMDVRSLYTKQWWEWGSGSGVVEPNAHTVCLKITYRGKNNNNNYFERVTIKHKRPVKIATRATITLRAQINL